MIAGPIVKLLDYHWLFWFPMIITALAAVATHLFVPESPVRTPGKISVLPAVLLSAWLVALLLALSEGGTWGWTSGRVLGLIAAAVVLCVAWVVVEERSESPLIDMKMMRLPAVWTTNLVALLVGFGMYASFGFLPQFSQTPVGLRLRLRRVDHPVGPDPAAVLGDHVRDGALLRAASPVASARSTSWSLGCLIAAGSMAIVAFAHDHEWQLFVATAVMGAGIGLVFACLSNLIVAAVPAEQTGVASGMNANIRTIGGSIGAAIMATIVTASTFPNGVPHESGYTNGFLTLTIVMVVAATVGLIIPRVRRSVIEQHLSGEPEHAQLGMVAAGTLIGDKSE